MNLIAITRQTSKGVPRYTEDDVFLNLSGEELMAERDANGKIKSRDESQYRGLLIGPHRVVQYWPRLVRTFDVVEYWYSDDNPEGFWVIHEADGSLHLLGRVMTARKADPQDSTRVVAWLLQESMNARGEHICYEYKSEDPTEIPAPHDYRAQRYLHRVLYGNVEAYEHLYGWAVAQTPTPGWHFETVFDYGERTDELTEKPDYDGPTLKPWRTRHDPLSTYGQGFEVGTRRLCQQVLMFHRFQVLGDKPVLVRRLLLEYSGNTQPWSYSQIVAAHYQAYDASGAVENMPPVEFDYSGFELNTQAEKFFSLENMPGIEDERGYQCVDLFGEGIPGFLCRYDDCWLYREPQRGPAGVDDIIYGPWTALSEIPIADRNKPAYQALMDLTGDGRLNWVIAQPGMCGFYTLNPDGTWSDFIPFKAFPVEFFHTLSQLGDLTGDGLNSLAMIGPEAVRIYANEREDGFAKGEDVPHRPIGDRLPLFSNSRSELVLFGNLLGSDMSELCRIRYDKIECWSNLGHGHFGKGIVMSALPFSYDTFDADRVRIADLNGSGAPALIYLKPDCFEIYLNRGGNGFEQTPIQVPWPEGIRYDRLCKVTLAGLKGLGCASLILTVSHMKPRHWVYHFVSNKPYLMIASNNMGCSTQVTYRSSAQEWLDEKTESHQACDLPFSIQVVNHRSQLDEITGNCLNQFYRYFQAYYDGRDREFRGFGLVKQIDSETASDVDECFTEPALVCSWFHNGKQTDSSRDGYFDRDDEAHPLGDTLYCRFHLNDDAEEIITPADEATRHAIARALAGSAQRVETYAANDPVPAAPLLVEQSRYIVREVRERGDHNPDAVLMPSLVEHISYHYERHINDPLCRHVIHLNRDAFGLTTHSITVSYARRRTEHDKPPTDDVDESKWWTDAHDPAQQSYYLNETRARFIHLVDPQGWKLGLPYQQRGNALVLPKGPAPEGLNPEEISYEGLIKLYDSPQWVAQRLLTTQSVYRYLKTDDQTPLADGVAEFEALRAPLEIAQLDKTALDAYDTVPSLNIRDELEKIGYSAMPLILGVDPVADKKEDEQRNLWSSRYGFAKYDDRDHFYKVLEYNETLSHGITTACHDDYCLFPKSIRQPDGCEARFEYDYYALQLMRSIEANDNVEEALYEPSGQPLAISFHGTEDGKAAGFRPLDEYERPIDPRPGPAIDDPKGALQNAASVLRKDLFSWMGELPDSVRQTPDRLSTWIAQGDVLPSLHIRASARHRLSRLKSLTVPEQALLDLIHRVSREPVHSVVLTADRYCDDERQQIQIVKAFQDGFGRPLQIKQLVEPGPAYVVEKGELVIEDGKPKVAHADPRWRVSERVEYNNKGLPARVFRPYFANGHHHINDRSVREFGYHDQNFYDVSGRLIKVINAKKDVAHKIIHPWYITKLDVNDTDATPPDSGLKAGKQ